MHYKPLYFDFNATTPVHSRVVEAMLPFFKEKFGNPGCAHMHGLEALRAAQKSRTELAALIKALPHQIFFTSCATESNNMVLYGTLKPGDELIVSAIEHPAVIQPARKLEEHGIGLKIAPVDSRGLVDPEQIMTMISPRTKLISIILANNETGAVQPVEKLANLIQGRGIYLHTDAAQAVGKIPVDVQSLGVDFLTIAGHKMYAPKGIGALFIRLEGLLRPIFYGGGQEKGIRPGTENIPYIAGLGQAAALARQDLEQEAQRQKNFGQKFMAELNKICPDFVLHSSAAPRLPGTMSIGFGGYRAGDILSGMIACNISASAGAACHGNVQKMSSVLEAMGVEPHYGLGTIRFSWGRTTSEQDMDELLTRLRHILESLTPKP